MKEIQFNIGNNLIPFQIGKGILDTSLENFKGTGDTYFIISDKTIERLYRSYISEIFVRKHIMFHWVCIDVAEPSKDFEQLNSLCTNLLDNGCLRSSTIIALGGGVLGNIAGLAASLVYRGIKLIHIPTTLLAMHDSVTSCKQAINHAGAKNIIGSYYQPEKVIIDTTFLQTLPRKQIISGKAELVKNALIFGGEDYEKVSLLLGCNSEEAMLKLIELGIDAKNRLLKNDPYEKKEAIVFEYGHTIGHAIELFSEGRLTHGESVAWGMMIAGEVSNKLGVLSDEHLLKHHEIINRLAVPKISFDLNLDKIMELALKDNKRGYITSNDHEIPMLLLKEVGKILFDKENQSYLVNVPIVTIQESIQKLFQNGK